jgi:uncharacterized membrane protein
MQETRPLPDGERKASIRDICNIVCPEGDPIRVLKGMRRKHPTTECQPRLEIHPPYHHTITKEMFSMLTLKKLAFATIALAVLTAMANPAQAGNYDEIHIKNETNEHIWVAIHYQPLGSSGFVSQGWWELCPGECAYIADSINGTIYFYAYSAESDLVWSGNDYFYVDGQLYPFFSQYTGPEWVLFTQRFTY